MRCVNKVTLLGYVGMDPKIITAHSGEILANLSVATSYQKGGKNGKPVESVTEWHRLVAFGRLAEIVRDYVLKGARVYVEGELKTRCWDHNGEKHYSTEIIMRELSLLSSHPADSQAGPGDNGGGVVAGQDEDIPF